MRRWLSIALVPLLWGCIPIGIRGTNMPFASLERPLPEQCRIATSDRHRRDVGVDLQSGEGRARSTTCAIDPDPTPELPAVSNRRS
jgi:hypothetical protein